MKKLILGITVTLFVAGTVAIASNNSTKKVDKPTCTNKTEYVSCPFTPECQPGDEWCTCPESCTK